tara:strand:- start:47 stop:478 length:432 start_codon:yes stop_codon:yes gene_type:complete
MADKLTPFDFIKSINEGRKGEHLLKDCKADQSLECNNPESRDKDYVSFIINRGLSYFKDTCIFANEMNLKPDIPARMQYDFYRHIVSPKRRFSKWGKKEKTSDDIKLIQKAYDYSREKAESVYPIFTQKQLNELRSLFDKGGK